MSISIPDHNHDPNFASTLEDVYNELRQGLRREQPTTEIPTTKNGLNFIGMWNGLRRDFSAQALRSTLGTMLQLEDFRMVQVVGDSGRPLSQEGREKAREVLCSLLNEDITAGRQTMLEYGYTASQYDANWIVNDLITSLPDLRLRTIANVVYKSAVAVEEWGSEATSNVHNFVLAYDHTETEFGDDTWLSDLVMSPSHGDVVVCLEGGPQTFSQVTTLCSLGVSVIAMTGLKMREPSSISASARFSAGHMLRLLCESLEHRVNSKSMTSHDKTLLEVAGTTYLDNLPEFRTSSNQVKYDSIKLSLETFLKEPAYLSNIVLKYVE